MNRIARVNGHDLPIKANQSAKIRYRSEFGTSLTGDMLLLLQPLLTDEKSVARAMGGGLSANDVMGLMLNPNVSMQEILTQALWACAWAADRSIPDYDQWTESVQDEDESAFALMPSGDLAPWAVEVETAVAKAFLGIDPTASTSKVAKSQKR